MWNVFDQVVLFFMIVSIILRYVLKGGEFDWALWFYATTLVLFYFRFMYVFYVSKNIGPKVIMIKKMVCTVSRTVLLF